MNIDSSTQVFLGNTEIVEIRKGNVSIWQKGSTPPPPAPDYFYVKSLEDNNTLTLTTTGTPETFEYSTDKSTWYSSTNLSTISLNNGDFFYMRSEHGLNKSDSSFHNIVCSGNCEVGGDIKTLVDYRDSSVYSIQNWNFFKLFYGNSNLKDSSSMSMTGITTVGEGSFKQMFHNCTSMTATVSTLPATTLGTGCYNAMYYSCQQLLSAPTLPATTLADDCYHNMFRNCAALTVAPDLPATTLTSECYRIMFSSCTALTTPPVIHATTFAYYSCASMFDGCSRLNNITVYANDISATGCLSNWLRNVSSVGTFYNNGSATYTANSASGIPVGWTEVDDKTSYNFFYIQNDYSGTNTLTLSTTKTGSPTSGTYATSVQYSKDKSTWTTLTLTASGSNTISLNQGEKVYFRNNNGKWNYRADSSNLLFHTFTASQAHVVGGDITTLVDYTDNTVSLPNGCFFKTFTNDAEMTSASNLILPSRVSEYCYGNAFAFCTNLTSLPSLPATTLTEGCYQGMFALTGVVDLSNYSLPATVVSDYAYSYMFQQCPNLTTPPSLPATVVMSNGYNQTFQGCTSLTAAPALPVTTLRTGCYYRMFGGCSSLTSAPVLPATTLASDCYKQMFEYCTSLTTAPVLPATTLAAGSYQLMFNGCSSLNQVTTYANNISASNCLNNWLNNVANSGTFYNNGSATYTTNSASGIPTGWTQHKIKMTEVVLTPATGTEYSVTANLEWSSNLTWTSADIDISNTDQGAGNKNAYLTFTPSEVSNGVLTATNNIDIYFQDPDTWFTLTVYNGNTVVDTQYIPYTIR